LEWGDELEGFYMVRQEDPPELYDDLFWIWEAYNFLLTTKQTNNVSVEQLNFVYDNFLIYDKPYFLKMVNALENTRNEFQKEEQRKKDARNK